MVDKLDQTFAFHEQALRLRVQRHQLLASNIANADTPNYKARDIDFRAVLQQAIATQASGQAATTLSTTSAGHMHAGGQAAASPAVQADALYRTAQQPSVDGNTVDMDVERMQFMDNTMHYEANLTFLNSKIKSLLAAIQG
jgi:flagellar basal-body rod protein FlgB